MAQPLSAFGRGTVEAQKLALPWEERNTTFRHDPVTAKAIRQNARWNGPSYEVQSAALPVRGPEGNRLSAPGIVVVDSVDSIDQIDHHKPRDCPGTLSPRQPIIMSLSAIDE
jgi:hypothetical protein